MEFQKMLTDISPFCADIYENCTFDIHRHCDIEIIQCVQGEIQVNLNGDIYYVSEGDVIVIGSMIPHSAKEFRPGKYMILKLGPSFLRNNFSYFTSMSFPDPVFEISTQNSATAKDMALCLTDIQVAAKRDKSYSELELMGGLYKFASLLSKDHNKNHIDNRFPKESPSIQKIENVIHYVWENYSEQISVEQVAELSNYSKEHFQKKFKDIVGISFHQYLNYYRVKIAKSLLSHTSNSVGEIADMVGFNDSKSFCRVFKKLSHFTPSEYREMNINPTA